MSKILLIIILILPSINVLYFCQTSNQELKDKVLRNLTNEKDLFVEMALDDVINYSIKEAIPILESNIWKHKTHLQLKFIYVLAFLKSENAHNIASAFIDSVDQYSNEKFDWEETALSAKANLNKALFMLNDYSKADYIIQQLRVDPNDDNIKWLLPDLVKEVPKYMEEVKDILMNASNFSENYRKRFNAVHQLEEIFGAEMIPVYLKFCKDIEESKDNYSYTRIVSFQFLCKYNYKNLESFIKEQVYHEPSVSYRIDFIDTLLNRYGSPSNIEFVKNFLKWEKDELAIELLTRDIKNYVPKEYPSNLTLSQMIDSLITLTNKMTSLEWIDSNINTLLQSNLISAKKSILLRDSLNCSKFVSHFQNEVDFEFNDTLNVTSYFVTEDAWNFLYNYASYILNRLPIAPTTFNLILNINGNGTVEKSPSLTEYDSSTTVTLTAKPSPGYTFKAWSGDITGTNTTVSVIMNSNKNITAAFIPASSSGLTVKLINSIGELLTSGTLQYYEGSWKNAVNNNDGTFTVNTTRTTTSLRMTYEYGSLTKQNVPTGNGDVIFQTVKAQVKLQDSNGNILDQGTVQYYAGAWRSFGTTSNGIAEKELLPANYSFRMTYAFASNDKQQDIGTNPVVVFSTVNAEVQLQNSQGALIDQGSVQYYSGAWRSFGTTTNGIAEKELLPSNYSFRMTYAFASNDKQQDIGSNPVVVFSTVNAEVQLQNSQGNLMDQGTVQYYSGAWREFGTTSNGVAHKELLPNNYSFRMTYAFANTDKQQNLNDNPVVVFKTINTQVQLKNSLGNLIDGGSVQYYSGAWRTFGQTIGGTAVKELLPGNYSFRITHEYVSNDKKQDIAVNNTVEFSTVLCTIRVKDAQNQSVNNAQASYYSGAWRVIGSTVNGEITKELLPADLTFRAKLGTKQADKKQNVAENNVVEISLP